jgi:hypothetical protein
VRAKKKNIKFTDRNHAVNGIISTILGGISLVLMLVLVLLSYSQAGNAGVYTGSIGLVAMIVSIVGLFVGISSFKERESYYLFSKIGSLLNIMIITFWIAIYVIGTF